MRLVVVCTLALAACGGARGYEVRATFGSSVPGGRAVERHPEVAALPVIGHVGGGRTELVLRGRMSRARAQTVLRMARATYRDMSRRFLSPPDEGRRPPVDVCIFFSNREFTRFVHGLYGLTPMPRSGFYLGGERLLVVNLARNVGNLRHELVHPLVGDDFPEIPDWLNEGLASLYATADWRDGRYRFLVNHRLRHLWRAQHQRLLPGLARLAASTYDDVHGPGWRTYYSLGCYLLLYLERTGRLDQFYRQMRAQPVTAPSQLQLLRAHVDYPGFLAWTRRLRVGMAIAPPSRPGEAQAHVDPL